MADVATTAVVQTGPKDSLDGSASPLQETRKEGRPVERDENRRPQQTLNNADVRSKRRTSESGLPGRRTSGAGTPGIPQQSRPGQKVSPRIQPRENRSSILRKSLSGSESNLLTSPRSASKDSGAGGAMGLELLRLKDDLRGKEKQNSTLDEEIATLRSSAAAKDRALARFKSEAETTREKLTQTEGELANKARELRALEAERNKLQSTVQGVEREADKLHRRLSASTKGTGLSEVVATLEAEVKNLKAENSRLEDDSKGVCNQLRAKDREIDAMGQEVEKARAIHMQNQELDNYMLDLRRQMQESSSEQATLLSVQRQNRADILAMSEAKEAAEREAASLRQELILRKDELKGSQENAMEISRELELQKTQLVRATNVASRAAAREAASLKEDGTVPFLMYKEEVMYLKGENDRIKEKLRLSEKSAAATQLQIQRLYKQLDILKEKR